MRLIHVLAILLTQFSIGTLLMTCLLPPREIRASFFTLNALLGALTAALALALTKFGMGTAWWDVRYLGLTVIGATVAFGLFRLEKPEAGRVLMIVAGLLGLVFGLLPLAGKVLAARGLQSTAPYYFDATMLAGAVLLGATNVGMILGHWYLIQHRLSFEHLERFAIILLGAVGLRLLVLLGVLTTLRIADPKLAGTFLPPLLSAQGDGFFFALRLLFGIIAPGVLAVMTLRCVKEKANRAATGLLYVCEISVLFGELFAAYLMV